eukprot:CAMPEP_0180047668 /NCGR_PEP_ID=MMETSP0984-20121128/37879_1 /TAXON_ID=483367 /ORGANISM="non described non described, Strain CCMP 2436" /LENGTH=310 /DNA_ID=CAMNT_0021976517 /DNA_START=39 /DNA_END=970 /DNA_ORIENTATION=+
MTVPLSVRDKGCAHTAPPLQPRGERANIKLAPFRGAAVPAPLSDGTLRVVRCNAQPAAAANLVRPQLVRDAAGVDHPSAPPQATVHVVVDRVCLFAALQGADKPIAREVVAGAHVVRYSLPSGALDGLRDQLAVAVADDRMTEEDAHEIEEMLTDTYGHGRRGAGPLYRLRGARRSPRAAVGSIHFGHRAKPPCRTAHLAGRAGAAAERAPAAPPPSPPPPSPPFPPPPAAPAAAEVGAAADDDSAQPGDAEADAARVAWARKALVPAVSRLSWAAVLKRIVDLSLREATDGGPQLGCTALQNMANRLLV